MRRSRWNAAAFLFSGALVLAACGQPGATQTPEPPTGTGPAATEPAAESAGQIVYAIDGQITTISNASNDVPTAEVYPFFYNALYQYNPSLEPVPDLAAEPCEISEDGLTYTCTLREGVTFHNGEALTADDVVFTYEIAQSVNCRFNPSLCLEPFLENVQATDDLTVEFTLTRPYAPFSTTILPGIVIDSRAVVEQQFEEFTGEAEDLDVEAAQAAVDELLAAAEPAEGDPDPAACEAGLAAVEELLEAAGQEVPARADFTLDPDPAAEGEAGEGEFDACGYASTIAGTLNQILQGLQEQGPDAIAAVYPLLPFNFEPIGTGPWMCEPGCFQPGESVTGTAYADYFDGPPATERIVFPIITDEVQIGNAIQAGEVDWHYSIPSDVWQALSENEQVKFAEYPDFGYFGLQYNLREGQLFADLGARKAVQYCIDKAETVRVATNDQGIPVEATIPPASWAYNPDLETVARDTEAAIGFLEEAGWTVPDENGDGIADGPATRGDETFQTQVYVRAGQPERIRFMELLRDQVRDCGIEIEVIPADFATVLLPLLTYPHIPPNATEPFDAYFGGWSTGFDPDPFSIWHSSQCTTEESPETYNYICFQNEQADELIDRGLEVTDQEERAEIYREFEAIVYEEQPYLFAWSDIAREAMDVGMENTEGELALESPVWYFPLRGLTIQQ